MRSLVLLATLLVVPVAAAEGVPWPSGGQDDAAGSDTGIGDPLPVWANPSIAGDGYVILHNPVPNVGQSLPFMLGWTGTVYKIPLGSEALCELGLAEARAALAFTDELF